jgi:hypothetical protein
MGSKASSWARLIAIAGALACANNRASTELALDGSEAPPVLTVQNDNFLDVNVYLVRGSSRFRIGTVSSAASKTFRLPKEGIAGAMPLRIMADPIGENRQYFTDPVVVGPGQRLELKVGSPLSISSFAIWNR